MKKITKFASVILLASTLSACSVSFNVGTPTDEPTKTQEKDTVAPVAEQPSSPAPSKSEQTVSSGTFALLQEDLTAYTAEEMDNVLNPMIKQALLDYYNGEIKDKTIYTQYFLDSFNGVKPNAQITVTEAVILGSDIHLENKTFSARIATKYTSDYGHGEPIQSKQEFLVRFKAENGYYKIDFL